MKQNIFGTDGVRGLVNSEPMTAGTALKLGQALGCVIKKHQTFQGRPKVVIGKDTRLSGYIFESALQAGLCSMGIDVLLMGPIPTPAVAFIADNMRAEAGIMITASHNPFRDNGIKIFSSKGFKLAQHFEEELQARMLNEEETKNFLPKPLDVGRAKRVDDGIGRYISSVKQFFLSKTTLDGISIVLDCAHGASYKVAPLIFEELGADVIRLGCNPNGTNINEKVGALHPEEIIKKTIETQADLGIAFDGDGDRVMAVDRKGKVYDGDDFLSIWMEAQDLYPKFQEGLVGTKMSNFGLEKKAKSLNIPFYRSDVGDRHVVEMLKNKQCSFGGEPSGHLVCLGRSTTGDGLLSAILLLNVLVHQNKSLDMYASSFNRFPQRLKNIMVREKKPLDEYPKIISAIKDADQQLKGHGRTLVRYSGTENKIRIMVESDDEHTTDETLKKLQHVIEAQLGV